MMPAPKLLFYTHGLVDGGAERLWACLASAFKQRGYDVTFAVDFLANDNAGHLDPGIPLVVLGRNHIRAVWRLAQLMRGTQFDVALSAVGGSNIKAASALFMSGAKTSSVLTFHGSVEPASGLLAYLSYRMLPLLSRRASRVVAVSEGLGAELVRKWGADQKRTTFIYNPVFVPNDARVPSREALAARDDIILAAGRLSPEKDFITLIKALSLVKRTNARLILLGKGPDETRIAQEIARLGLQDRVSMPGYCVEPWPYYQSAKCLVSSSKSELFGNTLVEAMAYGLPVVATRCIGPSEIIRSSAQGRLVAIGDAAGLAEAIDATLDDPGEPGARRERADEFSFAARMPAYEALVRDVVAGLPKKSVRLATAFKRTAIAAAASGVAIELDILPWL